MRASVEEATWRLLDDIGERRTGASKRTTIVWCLMKVIIMALAIHDLRVGGTSRLVVRGHLRRGEIESVTKVGIGTRTCIEIRTGRIETDMNGIETVNGIVDSIVDSIVNGTVTTVVIRTLSDRVVDSCPLHFYAY